MPGVDINKLTFGSDDAELDEKKGFLDKVFLKTSIYERAKLSKRELVIGRKGSGKSAICLMLNKAFKAEGMITILITPDALSKRRFEQLKTSGITDQQTYTLSWKYVLLTAISKRILEVNSKHSRGFKANKNLRSIKRILSKNGEVSLSFTEKIKKSANTLSKFSIKAFGIEGSVEARQLQEQIDLANELEKLQTNIDITLKEFTQNIFVFIDKVDDTWNPTKESEALVVGLIKSVHELNSEIRQTHFFLFLRSDIYDSLKFEDADKLRSLEEHVNWREYELKHLISTRGKVSAGLLSDDPDELWTSIFEKSVNGESSFSYIFKRTLKRPRELIQFCNAAVAEAQDNGHEYIMAHDVLNAEKQYSNWKYRDLAIEFGVQYPYLEDILSSFRGFYSSFSVSQFKKRFEETKAKLDNPEVDAVSNEKMLQILFIVGFLGASIGEKDIFSYDDSSIILAQQEKIVVHPAYWLALGLEKTVQLANLNINEATRNQINVAGDIVAGNKVVQTHYDPIISSSRELETLEEQRIQTLSELGSLSKLAESYDSNNLPTYLRYTIDASKEKLDNLQKRIAFIEDYLRSQKKNKYRVVATSKTPALVIYLLDVSASMAQTLNTGQTRIDALSTALQKVAVKMVQRSTKGATLSPRYRIAMFAYSSQVIDLLGGIKTINQLSEMGLPKLTTLDMTDTAQAFSEAEQLLLTELPSIQDHPAPLVCHLTDGEYNGGDPGPIARRIMALEVLDGNVLVENIYISNNMLAEDEIDVDKWHGIVDEDELIGSYSKFLFNISSKIPDSYISVAREFGYDLSANSRLLFPGSYYELLELGFAMSGATPITRYED